MTAADVPRDPPPSGLRLAVGIEDTFVPHADAGRRPLDEYSLTQHDVHWHADLGLASDVGATMIRYGVPWYRVNPARGVFEWSWLDQVVDRLDELGLEAIVDLVHYGTPLWLEGTFLSPSYPEAVAEYAARVAERYSGRLRWYTPLNEPLINAMYCGEDGRWPPYLRGHRGFASLVLALVRGIVGTQRAVAEATGGDVTFLHVEASVRFAGAVDEHADEVALLRERRFVIQDLLTGRVDDAHPLAGYLRAGGFDDDSIAWCSENTAVPDVVGVNYYPHLSTVEYEVGGPPRPERRRDDGTQGLEEVLRLFAERYGRPVFLTETSTAGSARARSEWLDDSLAVCERMRAEGVPIVGYTWWPLFDLVDWSYREGSGPPEDHLVEMGLYALRPQPGGVLRRAPTAAADRFRLHAQRLAGEPGGLLIGGC